MLDDIGRFISTVGFPVAVATFVLVRMNGKLDRLIKALDRLTHIMNQHRTKREEDGDAERSL